MWLVNVSMLTKKLKELCKDVKLIIPYYNVIVMILYDTYICNGLVKYLLEEKRKIMTTMSNSTV